MSNKPTLENAAQRQPLTPRIIADMKPGEELSDPECRGLRVRCTSSARVFFYRYRAADGALREIKIGQFGSALTLAGARKECEKKRQLRNEGVDPQGEKRKARDTARQQRQEERQAAYTLAELIEEYISECLSKQKRGYEGERLLRRELLMLRPEFSARAAVAITRRDLQDEVIRPVMLRAPRGATYLLSRIRCAYAHAADQGRLPYDFNSPTLGIKGAAQVRRKRAFTDAELATFLKWLPHSPYSRTVREALMLVLLTACRSGEVVSALWRDIDLERAVWPIRETKNGEPHDVMLSAQAIELLKFRQGVDKTFVFPSRVRGQHLAQKALGLAQYTARQKGENETSADPIDVPWTVHDLRRTVATGLAKLGCPRVVQDRILNHVDSSVSAIYDRHSYDAEARTWLQKWADHLDALKVRNVVPLDRAKTA
jgi:integrase